MNVLIIGAYGQLGRKIKDLAGDHALLDMEYHDIDSLDITRRGDVEAFFAGRHFDVVVNCAAFTAVDRAEDEESAAYNANVVAVENVAAMCCRHACKFIHISTDYVFDGMSNRPYVETAVPHPLSAYGRTKLAGEEAAMHANEATIIIRTAWLYSEYGKNFVKTISRAAQQRGAVDVVCDQIGTPTYAGDLAAAILAIIDKWAKEHIWHKGIYHFTNYGVCSWYDFAVEIIKAMHIAASVKPVLTEQYPTKATRPTYSVLDKSKIVGVYGLQIPHWRDSLLVMLDKLRQVENNNENNIR